MGYSVTLKYVASGSTYTRAYTALGLRGFNRPDNIRLFPAVQHRALNGGITDQFTGMRRIITVDFGVLSSADDMAFIANFLVNNTRSITYDSSEVYVAIYNGDTDYQNEWLDGIELGRRFVLTLEEIALHTSFPGSTFTASSTTTMYIKKKVQVTGTIASPETFLTNSGKLATRDVGGSTAVYPAFSASVSYIITLTPYQEAPILLMNTPSLSGTDITFQLAYADFGKSASDGNYYCDIAIGVGG